MTNPFSADVAVLAAEDYEKYIELLNLLIGIEEAQGKIASDIFRCIECSSLMGKFVTTYELSDCNRILARYCKRYFESYGYMVNIDKEVTTLTIYSKTYKGE
jgi:hypothetical protein